MDQAVRLEVIKFTLEAILKTFSFNWSKGGTRQIPSVSTEQPSVCEIQSVREDHYGHYKCEVKKGEIFYFIAHLKLTE